MTRRGFLQSGSTTFLAPSLGLSVLTACGNVGAGVGATTGRGGRDFALLLPRTGEAAALGENMARAASLVTQSRPSDQGPRIYDTRDTPEGAMAAATQAIENGAKVLLGPLRSDQTAGVVSVAGHRPVITFSNDDSLGGSGAFVMGVTPAQSVATMFSYALSRGLSRIAVVARPGPLAEATTAAANALAGAGGLTITAVLQRDPAQAGLAAALRAEGMPQAVFLPDGGGTLVAFAKALRRSDVQLMGSVQWGIADVTADANLDGAWFAAPPPDLFLPFADRFAAAFGAEPGVVAALGHDAALLAMGLGDAGRVTAQGIMRDAGFTGALGPFRFVEGGRCQRDLAVLGVRAGRYQVLAEVSGT
jgi:ABC-type branched-subunit amino acid transport system substrate-binding protein